MIQHLYKYRAKTNQGVFHVENQSEDMPMVLRRREESSQRLNDHSGVEKVSYTRPYMSGTENNFHLRTG